MSLYTVDFQKSILKLLCSNVKFVYEYGVLLKEEYFEAQPHRILFGIITKHILTYEKEVGESDLLVLVDEYVISKGFSTDVFVMLKAEVKEVFKVYVKSEQFIVDQLVKYCRRQELKSAIVQSVDILEKDGSYEQVLKLIDTAVSIGGGSNEGLSFTDLLTLPAVYKNKYKPEKLIRTGFHNFDNALMGGMAPGEVHVIVAPPKTGKSTLACNMGAYNLISGKAIYHISLELKEIDIMAKYATRLTGLTYQELLSSPDERYREKITRFNKYKPNLFVNYWTEKTANALTIRSWISRKRSITGISPELIIVDYDDCLEPVGGGTDDMYNDAGAIYTDLIGLADYFKCPVLTLAQPRREAWEKANKAELIHAYDLAHSARKAHKCYSITSLNMADNSNEGTLFVDMNRRGESSIKIKIKKDLSRGLFQEA